MQTDIDRWLAEGQALVAHKNYTLALIPLNRAVRQAHVGLESSKAWRLKSEALTALGHLDQALTAAEYAVRDQPDSNEALRQRGRVYDLLQRYAEAIADFERAVQHAPGDVQLWLQLGNARLNAGLNAAALEAYEGALAIDGASAPAWYSKGLALGRLQRRDEALAAYQHSLEIMPNTDPIYAKTLNAAALLLFHARRLPEARAFVEQVYKLDSAPADVQVRAWRLGGDILAKQRRYVDALAHVERALTLAPEDVSAWSLKGWLLLRLKQFAAALGAYDEALRLDPSNRDLQRDRLYALACCLLTRTPPVDPDAPAFAEIDDPMIWRDVLGRFVALGRFPQAEAAVNQVLRLDPGKWNVYPIIVLLQIFQKRFRAAAATLRQAWRASKRAG